MKKTDTFKNASDIASYIRGAYNLSIKEQPNLGT